MQRYNLENTLSLNYIKKLDFLAETLADFTQKLKRNAHIRFFIRPIIKAYDSSEKGTYF